METSLRDTIEEAFDASEQTGGSPADTTQPVGDAAQTTTPTSTHEATPETDRGDGRTPRGRFAAREAAKQAGDGEGSAAKDPARTGAGTPAVPATPATPAEIRPAVDPFAKPPQSWKPGAREAWGQLPADVRAEVHRREREAARIAQEYAPARQTYERIAQLQQQFAPALQAEGVDVLQATANLMNLSSRMRFGSPVEKAQLAAQIVRAYGVDIVALDAALSGAAMPPQGQGQQQMLQDPRVDQLLAQLQGIQQSRQQQVMENAASEVEEFGADKEFFEDVREDMADLLEVAARRKIDLTLDQAYERACKLQPDIAKVLEAREAAARAGNSQQSTQRAKHAASSIRGTPSSVSTPQPTDLRGAIEAAIEQVGGR